MKQELVHGQDHGVVAGGTPTANKQAMEAARAVAGPNRPVLLGPGDFGVQLFTSVYDQFNHATYDDARGFSLFMGTPTAPASTHDPIMMIEKVSSANLVSAEGRIWDAGCAYFGLKKIGGSSYSAVVTAYGEHSGGENDLVAMHARVNITTKGTGGRGWAIWGQTGNWNDTLTPWHVAELNAVNWGRDPGYDGGGQALRINMTDSDQPGNRMSTALSVGKAVNGGDNGFYTGINIEAGAIVSQQSAASDGEAIRINGIDRANRLIGGIHVKDAPGNHSNARFKYALRTDLARFQDDTVLFMGYDQRLQWGGYGNARSIRGRDAGVEVGVPGNGTVLLLNTPQSGEAVRVDGKKVLGRQFGGIPTLAPGNRNPDAWNNVINALISMARHHGLVDPAQTVY